jgi:hypothetical protein
MIRHARLAPALPILPLAVAVVEFAFRALLVAAIGGAALATARLLPACKAAITLPMVAIGAEKIQSPTLREKTKPLPQNHFAMRCHAGLQAALDIGRCFVAG